MTREELLLALLGEEDSDSDKRKAKLRKWGKRAAIGAGIGAAAYGGHALIKRDNRFAARDERSYYQNFKRVRSMHPKMSPRDTVGATLSRQREANTRLMRMKGKGRIHRSGYVQTSMAGAHGLREELVNAARAWLEEVG